MDDGLAEDLEAGKVKLDWDKKKVGFLKQFTCVRIVSSLHYINISCFTLSSVDWALLSNKVRLGLAFLSFRMGIRGVADARDKHSDGRHASE